VLFRSTHTITLSYTFHPSDLEEQDLAALDTATPVVATN